MGIAKQELIRQELLENPFDEESEEYWAVEERLAKIRDDIQYDEYLNSLSDEDLAKEEKEFEKYVEKSLSEMDRIEKLENNKTELV